jgi:hypothetical protein
MSLRNDVREAFALGHQDERSVRSPLGHEIRTGDSGLGQLTSDALLFP